MGTSPPKITGDFKASHDEYIQPDVTTTTTTTTSERLKPSSPGEHPREYTDGLCSVTNKPTLGFGIYLS